MSLMNLYFSFHCTVVGDLLMGDIMKSENIRFCWLPDQISPNTAEKVYQTCLIVWVALAIYKMKTNYIVGRQGANLWNSLLKNLFISLSAFIYLRPTFSDLNLPRVVTGMLNRHVLPCAIAV